MLIDTEPDADFHLFPALDYETEQDKVVMAIDKLRLEVVEAFAKHDHDLRAEVETVNSLVRWLIGMVALVGAIGLVWPYRRH